jgi:hypothetical protein
MGVIGGLPLMSLFIATLAVAFIFVGRIQQGSNDVPGETRFMLWGFGAALFAHTVSFISVSYFDQSILFVYMTLAAIGSIYSGFISPPTPDEEESSAMHGTCDFTKASELI